MNIKLQRKRISDQRLPGTRKAGPVLRPLGSQTLSMRCPQVQNGWEMFNVVKNISAFAL